MTKKLLNKKNLIIILIIAFIGIFCMQTPVYAATSFSDYIKESVLGIYELSRYICIFVLFVVAVACFINVFISKTPRAQALFKRTVTYIIVGLVAIVFLTYIIDAMFVINDTLLENCENLGKKISQIDSENNEITMYDSAISKAYELRASSGFIGMFLYVILVYYCAKFFVIYLRRYINIMILILVSPWVITRHVILKTFRGTSGKVGLWAKEMIFNIFIQALHAVIYASLIGLTLRLSDTFLSFIGVILTLVVFSFISSIEKLIRRLFNFVGGSSSVKSSNTQSIKDFATHPIQTTKERANSFVGSVKEIPSNVSNSVINFKDNVGTYMGDISSAINGENLNVSQEEIKQQQESMDAHPNMMKVENAIKSTPKNIKNKVNSIKTNVKKIKNNIKSFSSKELKVMKTRVKKVKQIYNNDLEVVKRISRFFIHYKDRRAMEEKVESGTATQEELELVSQFNDAESLDDEVKEMENAIKKSDDLVGEVYKSMGPSAFILPEKVGGSPYLGIVTLASANEFEREMRGDQEEDQKESGETTNKRTIRFPSTKNYETRNNKGEKQRKYTFKEFSPGSVDTITNYLMIQTLLQDETVRSLMMGRNGIPYGRVGIKQEENTEEVLSKNKTEASHGTITYRSNTKREDLLELQGKVYGLIQNYNGINSDNKWANYVSENNNVTRIMNEQVMVSESQKKMGSNMGEQSTASEYGRQKDRNGQMFSGVVVATAMKYGVALENVNVRNDSDLQDEFIKNLTRYELVPEEVKTDDIAREQAIQRLEEEIHSLTTDDRETYFKMAAAFSDMAEKAGIEIGNETADKTDENIIDVPYREVNEETKENNRKNMFEEEAQGGNKKENKQGKKVSFKQNTEPADFVEDVVDGKYRKVDEEGNNSSVLFKKLNGYLDGYIGKVVDAAIEFGEYGDNEKETTNETVSGSNEVYASSNNKTNNNAPVSYGGVSGNRKNKDANNDKDKGKNQITYHVYGEVVKQGKYSLEPLPKGRYYTIDYALKNAGGVTDDADLDNITADSNKTDLDAILENEMVIRVHKKSNSIDAEEEEREYREVVNSVIETYIEKENIKDYSVLRERENERNILKQVNKGLEDTGIIDTNDDLIKDLIEKRIKEIETLDKYLNKPKEENEKNGVQTLEKQLEEQARKEKAQEELTKALNKLAEERAVVVNDPNNNNNGVKYYARDLYLNRAAG